MGNYTPLETAKEAVGAGLQIGTTILPMGAAEKAVGTAMFKAGAKALPTFIAKKAVSGAVTGAGLGLGQGLLDDKSAAEIVKQTIVSTLTGSALNVALGSVTAGVKKTANVLKNKLPEKLYSQIYKSAEDDIMNYLETTGLQDIQKNNPELFKSLVARGRIRTGAGGKIEVNPTLAQEVLERGNFGSVEQQAKYAFGKMYETDQKIYEIVSKSPTKYNITLDDSKAYKQLLQDIADRYDNTVFSARGTKANELLAKLKNKKTVTAETALELRRFLDSMRNTQSFRDTPTLAAKQEEFKTAANMLRSKLAAVPGIKPLMNEYRVWIQSIDDIVSYAKTKNNTKLLNLTDLLVGGGGLASGFPGTGLGAVAGIRAFQSPASLTGLGQTLNKIVPSPKVSQTTSNILSGVKGTGIKTYLTGQNK